MSRTTIKEEITSTIYTNTNRSVTGNVLQGVLTDMVDDVYDNVSPFESGTGSNSAQQKGTGAVASGASSVAEGNQTTASGGVSHAEGSDTTASGFYSHAEGAYTLASGRGSHAEGVEYNEIATSAKADAAHAEGAGVVVKGQAAHGEGLLNVAGRTQEEAVAALADFPNLGGTTEQKVSKLIGFASHSEGSTTQALGTSSHAEGNSTQALVNATHAEGDSTTASGEAAHSEGYNTLSSGNQAHAEGFNTQATANQAHSEGKKTIASAENAHSEGNETKAVGNASHSEGYRTYAYGAMSHIEGTSSTLVSDANAALDSVESIWEENGHNFSLSRGQGSHVEGKNCLATGDWSHAEGVSSSATNIGSHAEGSDSIARGRASHAEGSGTASGSHAHAEGSSTIAQGAYSHAEGYLTTTSNEAEHAEGKYNISISGSTIHTVGIGTLSTRKNAHVITTDGKHYIPGIGTYQGTETTLPAGQDVATIINDKENKSNKVTSLSSASTDTEYPSAKCVYDALDNTVGTPRIVVELGNLTAIISRMATDLRLAYAFSDNVDSNTFVTAVGQTVRDALVNDTGDANVFLNISNGSITFGSGYATKGYTNPNKSWEIIFYIPAQSTHYSLLLLYVASSDTWTINGTPLGW